MDASEAVIVETGEEAAEVAEDVASLIDAPVGQADAASADEPESDEEFLDSSAAEPPVMDELETVPSVEFEEAVAVS